MLIVIKYWWAIVIVILCLIVGYQYTRIKSLENQHLIEAKNAYEKLNTVSAQYEAEKQKQKVKTETIVKTIVKTVNHPVYTNVCIDDDGRMQLNSLINQSNTK